MLQGGSLKAPVSQAPSGAGLAHALIHAAAQGAATGHAVSRAVSNPLIAGNPAAQRVAAARAVAQRPLIPAPRQVERRFQAEGARELQANARAKAKGASPLNLGFVDLTPVATALATAHLLPSGHGVLGTLGRIGNEAVDLPAQSFLSGAMAGTASRELVKGHPQQAETLGRSVLDQVEHPIRSFEQAPLSTALVLAGGENALGRLGGAFARTGALGDRLAEAAATARPDLELAGNEKLTLRQYDKDPLRKAAQVAYEKLLPHLPGPLRQEDAFQATGSRLERNMVGKTLKVGRTDRIAAAQEATRRVIVKGVAQQLAESHPGADVQHLVPLILERVVRRPDTALGDLQLLKGKWEAAQSGLKGTSLKANRANLANLDELLKDPAALQEALPRAFAVEHEVQRVQRPMTAAQIHGGKLGEPQLKASLFPYAQLHMGAVYGHDVPPDLQAAYEHGLATHADAQAGVRVAEEDVRRAENARSRVVGARGRGRTAQAQAAAGGGTAKDAAEGVLRGAKERLARAKATERSARDGVPKRPEPVGGLKGAGGEPLSSETILGHMRANGVEHPGYLSHKVGVSGRSSFYKSSLRQPALERFGRTGKSFENGSADHSWEALMGTVAKQASEVAQLEVRARTLNRLGIRPAGTGDAPMFKNEAEAKAAIDNFHATAAGEDASRALGEVVPVHVGSQQIVRAGNIHPSTTVQDTLRQFGLEEHTPVGAENYGSHVLMHKGVVDRLNAHDAALSTNSDLGRFLQVYQQAFRRAKLNTSIPHVAGVVQEQAIRLGAEGVAPAIKLGNKTIGGFAGRAGKKFTGNLEHLAQIDGHGGHLADDFGPLGARFREYEGAIANRGGLAGSQRANDVVRKADQFQQTSALGYIMHGSEAAGKSKLGDAIGKPWRAWKATIEGGLSHVEHGTRDALLAKALKDTGIIKSYRGLIHSTDEAVQALIAGKMTPQIADALAERVDNMGGNWNRQTPAVRAAIGKYAPFGLWWLNSMRWLYRLPVTHPIKTAIGAALYHATEEQRGKLGQGFNAAHPVPGFLQGTVGVTLPVVGKVQADPSHYSPGGTGGPEALNTLLEQFLPAGRSVEASAEGVNPLSKRELTGKDGKPLTIGSKALNVLAEGTGGPVPFATQAQKLMERGGKEYGTANWLTDLLHEAGGPSQVKPHTERPLSEVFAKLLSPVRFDFPSAGHGAGGGGGGKLGYSPAELHEIKQAAQSTSKYSPGELEEIKRLATAGG